MTPQTLDEIFKSSLHQLSSHLHKSKLDPELVKSWNSLMEKHIGEWMKWTYEGDDLRMQAGPYDITKSTANLGQLVSQDGAGNVDDGEVG